MSEERPHPPLGGIHEAGLYVDDLEAAERFWTALGLPVHSRQPGRHVFLRAGRDMLLLFDPDATRIPGGMAPPHGARGPGHVALDVPDVDTLEAWRVRLSEADVDIEAEVEWPNGRRSLYFRDPAGNSIELIERGAWGQAPRPEEKGRG